MWLKGQWSGQWPEPLTLVLRTECHWDLPSPFLANSCSLVVWLLQNMGLESKWRDSGHVCKWEGLRGQCIQEKAPLATRQAWNGERSPGWGLVQPLLSCCVTLSHCPLWAGCLSYKEGKWASLCHYSPRPLSAIYSSDCGYLTRILKRNQFEHLILGFYFHFCFCD